MTNLLYSGLLAIFLYVDIATSVIPTTHNAINFENEPYSAWECQTAQSQIETIQLWPILRAMNRLIDLWDHKSYEQWLTDIPYPQRVPTNQILYWPSPTNDVDDPNWLCNLNGWVGSYPVIHNDTDAPTETTDPGQFRALVSSSYKKEGTGADVSYTFAFCGLASRTGNKYEMCWPLDDTDEEQGDFS